MSITRRRPYGVDTSESLAESARYYSADRAVSWYAQVQGFQHPGEAALLRAAAPFVREKRILDVGVGGGRTIPLLLLLSDNYIGIDYSEAMVAACRRSHPGVEVRVGNAISLEGFEDSSVDFVYFSYNGLDTLDEPGRRQSLAAIHRVLSGDGIFAMSTLNKHGRSFEETPFQFHRRGQPWDTSAPAVARLIWRNARDPGRIERRYKNWWKARSLSLDEDGWGWSPLADTDFVMLNHFVTLARLREELVESGFEVLAIYGSDTDGPPLAPDASTASDDSLYPLARKH